MSIVLAWQSQAQNNQDAQSGVECAVQPSVLATSTNVFGARYGDICLLYEHSED